ncbi:MAG: methionine synthase, partial [Muribaculaceae bacterium]|nr:methionine synthase [Muribaculaceae bacterium]
EKDYVGVFCVTAGRRLAEESERCREEGDAYGSLLCQTLADRLAEAASEWLHMEVRRNLWGYSPDENLTIDEIFKGAYAGIRPAVGYPMMPDQLLNHKIATLLPLDEIGVEMTENGAMSPSSTVSGLYIASPSARYFMTGEIGDDQLADYSGRRGIEIDRMRELLRL